MKQNQLNCERMFEWQLLLSCVSHKKGTPLLFQQSCVHSTKQRGHFFFHLKHGHWHHNSRYTTFFFFKAAILVKCTNTKQISFLPPGGPCKFHISHSFSSQRSIRAWYPMRLSSAVHQFCLQEEKKTLFQYKCVHQIWVFPLPTLYRWTQRATRPFWIFYSDFKKHQYHPWAWNLGMKLPSRDRCKTSSAGLLFGPG